MPTNPEPTLERIILAANKAGYRLLNLFQVRHRPEPGADEEWRWQANVRKGQDTYAFGQGPTAARALIDCLKKAQAGQTSKGVADDDPTLAKPTTRRKKGA